MKTITVIVLVITLIIAIGCEEKTIVEVQAPTDQEFEAIVKGNTLTLLEAVELFALDNYGCFPESADSDTTVTGKILIDYLPKGERLLNPYTGLKDQPTDIQPTLPGEICYYKYHVHEVVLDESYDFYLNVYFIKGYGTNSIIAEHDNIYETEALVVEDCLELQEAVEAWHKDCSAGYYPNSLVDNNDLLNTVIDYLPHRCFMKNRFSMYPTEPSADNYTPAAMGAIGYGGKEENGATVGYRISAIGFVPEVIIFHIEIN